MAGWTTHSYALQAGHSVEYYYKRDYINCLVRNDIKCINTWNETVDLLGRLLAYFLLHFGFIEIFFYKSDVQWKVITYIFIPLVHNNINQT